MSDTDSIKPQIIKLLDQIQNILIAVATGGPKSNEVNAEYKELYSELTRLLSSLELDNPISYTDIWKWYGKWSSGDLPTYHSRRKYIIDLIKSVKIAIENSNMIREIDVTGWPRVDRAMTEIHTRLMSASNEEQFQSIGHYCREVLISLVKIVFDPDQHPPLEDGNAQPSSTGTKSMLDRYLAAMLDGKHNKFARKYAKASLDLANKLQHDRNASHRDAMLCAEATASVVNFVAIISGRRDLKIVTEQPPNVPEPPPF